MGWLILFSSILVSLIIYVLLYDFSEFTASAFQCLTILVPLLYYSGWNYHILFHKPDRDEIILAVTMFLGYIIYALIMLSLMDLTGMVGAGDVVEGAISLESFLSLIFYMMVEELLKFIPLMFLMGFFYKFSENRNISFILSSVIVMAGFGLLHYGEGLTVYSVLLIQGLGTIFELYGYYKTKNLFVPYLSHLFTDMFLMGLTFLPF